MFKIKELINYADAWTVKIILPQSEVKINFEMSWQAELQNKHSQVDAKRQHTDLLL